MDLKTVFKKFYGYCPHLDAENEIRAEYHEVAICGSLTSQYKFMDFDCRFRKEGKCNLNRECPLCKIAVVSKP